MQCWIELQKVNQSLQSIANTSESTSFLEILVAI